MSVKQSTRQALLSKRNQIENREAKSNRIARALFASSAYQQAELLLCYVSVRSEVVTDLIIHTALQEDKEVAVPYCKNSSGDMDFYRIQSLEELREGTFHVPEPDINFHKRVEDFKNSIIIVPGVAFSERGFRLGYGGGYYDRFLAAHQLYSIGLCYEEMLYGNLPTEEFDLPVHMVITDNRVIDISGGNNGL